jgi:hypothetical protein
LPTRAEPAREAQAEQSSAMEVGCRSASAASTLPAFAKVFEQSVSALALGKAGKAALISGGVAQLFDGARWSSLEPPLGPNAAALAIFFGRDNEPRVLGFSEQTPGEPRQVYLRCKQRRLQPAPDELGRLAARQGALYGVLGFEDPEVVCRAGQSCLVKRASGWANVPAHPQPVRTTLSAGTAFALHAERVEQLGPSGFVELEPRRAFRDPRAVWIEPGGVIWVVDAAGELLVRKVDGEWREQPSPLSSAQALWGSAANDVWLVGTGGAAHFDGQRWSCVREIPGPLEFVSASEHEVWLAGQSGAWRAPRVRSPRN